MENEILQDILSEIRDMKSGLTSLVLEVADMKTDLADVKDFAQNTNRAVTVIENEWFRKVDAALDGFSLVKEVTDDHEKRIGYVEKISISHSIEIEALKTN